jgi:hypothetical protein
VVKVPRYWFSRANKECGALTATSWEYHVIFVRSSTIPYYHRVRNLV